MNESDDQGAVTHELPEIRATPDPVEEFPSAPVASEAPGDGAQSAEPQPAEPPSAEEPPSFVTTPSPTCATRPGWTAG